PGVRAFGADLSTSPGCVDAVRAATDHFGAPPAILVNNVGIGRMLPFEELSDEDFHRTFELNFFSVVRTCRELLPLMRAAGGGSVVNVTSDLGGQPETVFVDYQASKAAVANLTKALALTYAPTVRVNAVAPGPIATPLWFRPGGFLEVVEKNYGLRGDEALSALIQDRGIPMGRLGDPQEVAAAVAYLASPIAGYTTGSSVGVNGGTVRSAF
ncbi:SDR family oxidoreductase, partial [Salmonella enterica subsp. enterica serovar Saintpaul]|nr:SDR family oxidoreductase [Salmonella enterica subsp. enterica serovar Saintpaul]